MTTIKAVRGPAHPINVPCPRCGVPAGVDCRTVVRGRRCPEREGDNVRRLEDLTNLRSCDKCDGPISGVFYRVSVEQQVAIPDDLTVMLGYSSLVLCPDCFCGLGGVLEAIKRPDKAEAVRP